MSVAHRYAQALFELAMEKNKRDQFAADMDSVARSLDASRQWTEWLAHPQVSAQQKQSVIRQIFAEKVSPEVLNLLLLLTYNGRETLIEEVAGQFGELADASKNVAHAVAISAQPLTEAEESHLIESLHQMTGRTILLQKKVDPELVGGVMVRIGDRLYDGSVKGLLNRLQRQMVS